MSLATLKPRLTTMTSTRIALAPKAGTTEMERGRAWMDKRRRVAAAHQYQCTTCHRAWESHRDQIDHVIPREQGGSNDESNLQPLCNECHKAKTDQETKARAGR